MSCEISDNVEKKTTNAKRKIEFFFQTILKHFWKMWVASARHKNDYERIDYSIYLGIKNINLIKKKSENKLIIQL